jgi:hypothetical protein
VWASFRSVENRSKARAADACLRIAGLSACLLLAGCSIPEAQFRRLCREHFKVSIVNEAGWAIVRSAVYFRDAELDPFPLVDNFHGHAISTEMANDPPVSIAIGMVSLPRYAVAVDGMVVAYVANPVWVPAPYEYVQSPSCTAKFPDEFWIFAAEQTAGRAK